MLQLQTYASSSDDEKTSDGEDSKTNLEEYTQHLKPISKQITSAIQICAAPNVVATVNIYANKYLLKYIKFFNVLFCFN